jgi:hypothetical protein
MGQRRPELNPAQQTAPPPLIRVAGRLLSFSTKPFNYPQAQDWRCWRKCGRRTVAVCEPVEERRPGAAGRGYVTKLLRLEQDGAFT